jgi:peptidoglycan/LPS O-acetylase OafA/YrhL
VLLVVLASIERGVLWQYSVGGDPYYRTDTHADGILLGCALAVARSWPATSAALKGVFRSTTLAVIACGVLLGLALALTLNSAFLFLGGYAFVTVSAAIVIGHAVAAQRSIVSRFLALPVLRWIGERSYGVYLFHVPIILLLSKERIGVPTPVAFAVQVAVTFAVTALSYRFVELRFLKKRRATEPQNSPPPVIPPIPARELAPGQASD